MAGKQKRKSKTDISIISEPEFLDRVRKQRDSTTVTVNYGDLIQILKASKRVIKFSLKTDLFLSGHLAMDTEDMCEAHLNINSYIDKIRSHVESNAKEEVKKKYRMIPV